MRGINVIDKESHKDKGIRSGAFAALVPVLALLSLFCMAGRFSVVAFAYEGNEEYGERAGEEVAGTEGNEEVSEEAREEAGKEDSDFFQEGWKWEPTEERSREADRTGTVVTNGGRLNLRTGAGMEYGIIDRLSPGEEVQVAGEENGWYKVVVSEKTGYVWGEYLKISEASDKSIVDGQDSMDGEILKMLLYLMMQEAGKAAADQEPISETDGGLEPEGNLTLVDDLGSDSKEGQQFVTLVTKAGNYFYLVIDRSKDGEENVHFLNMVDEADLMALMEEEEAEKFFSVPEGAEEAAPTIPPDAEGEMELGKAEEPPMEEQQASGSMLPLFGVFLLVFGGIGGFFFIQTRKKKQKDQAKPDPDGDYSEEEDVLELPEEDVLDEEEDSSVESEDDEPA